MKPDVGRAALVGDRRHGDAPAGAGVAQALRDGDLDVVVEHLGGLGLAVGQDDGPHLDAGHRHGGEQAGDAAVLGHVGIGAHQHQAPVGVLGPAGPHLLAVDQVVVVEQLGPGPQRGQVGAGARLAEPLTPADVAVQQGGQEPLLLLLGPVGEDGPAQVADARDVRGVGPARLVVEDGVVDGAAVLAAVLLGPPHPHVPALVQGLVPAAVQIGELDIVVDGPPVRGIVLVQPLAQLGSELRLFRGVPVVHLIASWYRSASTAASAAGGRRSRGTPAERAADPTTVRCCRRRISARRDRRERRGRAGRRLPAAGDGRGQSPARREDEPPEGAPCRPSYGTAAGFG